MDRFAAVPTVFLALVCAALPCRAAESGMAERLAACAACHGKQGEGQRASEYYPHLAGKPAGYLGDQLRAFRDGRRVYPQMTWLMRNMSDAYLDDIAAYYSALPPRSEGSTTPVDATLAQRAQQLVREGDPSRNVPACAACHGDNLAGLEPNVPALVGLPADYVVAQLGMWREGGRTARAPDCMAQIAKALQPADFRALGAWLSTQGHEAPMRPAPAGSFYPARECGTESGGAP